MRPSPFDKFALSTLYLCVNEAVGSLRAASGLKRTPLLSIACSFPYSNSLYRPCPRRTVTGVNVERRTMSVHPWTLRHPSKQESLMQHKSIDLTRGLADIQPSPQPASSIPSRKSSLAVSPNALRADNSPLTVAFEDPVLYAEGLTSDKLGDALTFFETSEDNAHCIMCSCLYAQTMSAGMVASRVRSLGQVRWPVPAAVLAGMSGLPAVLRLLS
jgi:hypothetical protein